VRLTTSHRKTLLLGNLNRGGQGPIWAVAPLDGWIRTNEIQRLEKRWLQGIYGKALIIAGLPDVPHYMQLSCMLRLLKTSAIFFFWKRFRNAKSDPTFSRRGVVLVIQCQERKVPAYVLWERTRSSAFRHKKFHCSKLFCFVMLHDQISPNVVVEW
jgi:hypothetical protein